MELEQEGNSRVLSKRYHQSDAFQPLSLEYCAVDCSMYCLAHWCFCSGKNNQNMASLPPVIHILHFSQILVQDLAKVCLISRILSGKVERRLTAHNRGVGLWAACI